MKLELELTTEETLKNQINVLSSKLYDQNKKMSLQAEDNYYLRQELDKLTKENEKLYDFNSDIYFTLDQNFIIKKLNFQAALLLNIDRNKLINYPFLNFIASDYLPTFNKSIQTLFAKRYKQTCELEILQKGGKTKYVRLECIMSVDNLIHLCLIDRTQERVLVKQAHDYKMSLSHMEDLFQQTEEAIATVDTDLCIKLINSAFIKLFTNIFYFKVQSGTNLKVALAGFHDLKLKVINACMETKIGKKISIVVENNSNNSEAYYFYEIYIVAIYNQTSQKKESIIRIKNMINYKLQEKRQYKQLSDISLACTTSTRAVMVSALAHEINQPLTAILAYSRSLLFLIDKTQNDKYRVQKFLQPIEKIAYQAELAGNIIHNMLGFIRKESFDIEKTDVNVLINDTISILNYELLDFKLTIRLNLMADLPEIFANKIHIMQVLLNLARNSIDALRSAEIKPNSNVAPELLIETKTSEDYVVISIRDNGPGIPKKLQNKILNTYFTTKAQGTGIGLGVCQTIVNGHGGELSYQPRKTRGSCFQFTLPLRRGLHANT